MANDAHPEEYYQLGEGLGILDGLETLLQERISPPDPTLALKDTARRALADHLPKWRKNDFDHGVYDFQVRAILPSVTDNSFRAKENPSEALLVSAAYQILVEEGFEAVNGQWYIPNPARR